MTVVAVGVFDGLHRGHRVLFDRALALASGGRCVAVSFDPHPDVVLAREFRALAPLTPLPEKQLLLARMGVELHVLPFTRELAGLSPETFVDEHLVRPFGPACLVVGADFALGRARAGNVARLREIGAERGFTVEAVDLLQEQGGIVSSSRIRDALAEGRVGEAAGLLGRRYSLTGLVVHGDKIGRTLGWPTANLRLHDEKLVPALGIYAVWARIAGDGEWRAGAMSVGIRPTFDGKLRTLEVHLLDWDGDIYGRDVEVQFVEWLRPELRFDGREALIEAIRADVENTRRRLREPGNEPQLA
ncbi:MAG: bifunctional riboflavin kinase/FAD synthetase [Candidatus Eisenbacteria bacterium]|nr:bifunctional riboflavin kinase/FAD synthetase [Candidatus Eisenbacteria bacterium]